MEGCRGLSGGESNGIATAEAISWRFDRGGTVRDNEVALIPDGYHPVVAAHGYDCYYLNVLAGSARSMATSDDPELAWVRGEWRDKDPRVPVVQ